MSARDFMLPIDSRKGISFPELLVAVLLVSVLFGMLLNALKQARLSTAAAACMNNLKQLGLACHLYTEANQGLLPYPNDSYGYEVTWYNALDPHLLGLIAATNNASQRLHQIKQDPVIQKLSPSWVQNAYTVKMNQRLGEAYPSGLRFYALFEIRHPARTVLLFDGRAETECLGNGDPAAMAKNPQGTEGFVARRHGEHANVLFIDGHVESRSEKPQSSGGLGWAIDQTRLIWKPWSAE